MIFRLIFCSVIFTVPGFSIYHFWNQELPVSIRSLAMSRGDLSVIITWFLSCNLWTFVKGNPERKKKILLSNDHGQEPWLLPMSPTALSCVTRFPFIKSLDEDSHSFFLLVIRNEQHQKRTTSSTGNYPQKVMIITIMILIRIIVSSFFEV